MAEPSTTASSTVLASAKTKRGDIFFNIVHERNVGLVKTLLDAALPVGYGPDWYTDLVKTSHDFTKMAHFNDIFVGTICCAVQPGEGNNKKLYIMALAVLAAYRGYGVGSALLNEVLNAVKTKQPDIKEIYLHVWTKNEEAVEFYKKFGFTVSETVEGYYRRIDPPDAYVLRLAINAGSESGVATSGAGAGAATA